MPWCPALHASDEDAGQKSDLTTPMSFWYYIMVSVNYSLTCGMAEEQKGTWGTNYVIGATSLRF